ncbi:GreA/GreB family elongation factor [Candidatus Acetothermia bacterium]|nr:GreA/GreB family elongation factor [Candidatus Acetothermia bacterium]
MFYAKEVKRLEEQLQGAQVIDEVEVRTQGIELGCRVVLEDVARRSTEMVELVNPEEADVELGKISTQSPVGKALLGLGEGAEVQVQTPAGRISYRVVGIEKRKGR